MAKKDIKTKQNRNRQKWKTINIYVTYKMYINASLFFKQRYDDILIPICVYRYGIPYKSDIKLIEPALKQNRLNLMLISTAY